MSRLAAEDLLTLQGVDDAQIAPDGARVAFVRRWVDREKNKERGEIWMASPEAAPRRFTGGGSDGEPRWSPDGRWIAFVSDRNDDQAQIFVIPTDGGEARAVSRLEPGAVRGLHWSPDGSQIAFLFRATPAAYTKKAQEERKTKGLSSPPRVHTHLFYRLDGFGYWDGSYWQVWTIQVPSGQAQALTMGEYNADALCWSPDGRTLAFLSDRRPDGDAERAMQDDIWTVPAGGGDLTCIPSPPGEKSALAWSPDGHWFAYVGNPDPLDQWGTCNDRVFVLPADGAETASDLTGPTDKPVGYLTVLDMGDSGEELTVRWSADGECLFFPVSEAGDTRLYRADVAGGEPVALTPPGHVLGSFSLSAAANALALTLASPTEPRELFVCGAADGGASLQRLTDLNRAWRDETALQSPEPFTLTRMAEPGAVAGWYLLPPGFTADGTSPFVLYVHGGPHLQYGNGLFHELQWLAARGYVVAYANPRGSKGYGERHTGAIKGNWGGPALEDLLRMTDDALARGYAAPGKMAIMGGSYGGYMAAWAVGHTDRFACAIADRLVANLHSMAGTCDFPWSHGTYYQGNAWSDPSDLWAHSPLAYAGQINTPLLLIHSDGDLRCPAGQAEELFAALRLQKKTVEFVRYPSETSHGLSRSGPPDLRIDRLQRNLAWLDRWLKRPAP